MFKLGKLVLFRRDTVRDLKWLDYEHGIYDEAWHRYYILFGVFKFDLTFKDRNDVRIAEAKKSRPVSGFNPKNGKNG